MVLSAALLGGPRQQLQQQLTAVQDQLTEVQQQRQQQLRGVQQQLIVLQGQLSTVQQQQTEMQDRMLPVPDTPGGSNSTDCPVNWGRIGNSCYLISPDKTTWVEAKQACSAFHPRANPVSIHPDNNHHVFRLLEVNDVRRVWIGLFKLHHRGGSWGWTDGTPLDYTDWYPGEPNNVDQGEHCGALWRRKGYQWLDVPCDCNYSVLCQIYLNRAQ